MDNIEINKEDSKPSADSSAKENIIKSFGNVISLNVLKTSFILLIIGVILFIVYIVLRKLLYKEPEEDCTLVENHIIPRFIDKVLK